MSSEILRLKDVYGKTHYVSAEDWNDTQRFKRLVPLRFKTGRKLSDAVIPKQWHCHHIHRENVAEVSQ